MIAERAGGSTVVRWELETVIGAVMVGRPGVELMGGEPVLPGVFPVMLHNPGDPPPPAPSLPICGPKH